MTFLRIAVVALCAVLALASTRVDAAVTTTVVDIPLSRGATQRILYVRPDAPVANLVSIPGGSGTYGIGDDGSINDSLCNPYARNLAAFAARGIAVALVDQTSDFAHYQFADVREVARYMRGRDNVPIWVTGGSSSTKSSVNFAASYPPEGPLGLVVFSPDPFDPDKAALVRTPALVIFDSGDTGAKGGSLFAALTSATPKEIIALSGGTNAGCGYHLFQGLDAEFVASVGGFIDRHNAETGAAAAANYQGLWWNAPANSESGWGINLAHQGDKIFVSWFTYDTTGKGWWLVGTMDKTGTNTYGGKLYTTRGPAFNAVPWDPNAVVATEAGTGTLTFTDVDNGSFRYVIGAVDQTKTITREVFGPLPTCTFGTVTDLTTATNYQDLWWKNPANTESGWGINLNHEGDTIFATWFTYELDGSPLWLVASAPKTGPGVYSGDLYRTSGARFDAFKASDVVPAMVGTATFTVVDGNTVTFDYEVQLAGMANPVTQSRSITREIFTAPGTTCR